MTPEQAEAILKEAESHLTELRNQRAELSEKREKCKSLMEDIDPFRGLVFDVHSLLKFRYVKYRFGRISKEYFDKFVDSVKARNELCEKTSVLMI